MSDFILKEIVSDNVKEELNHIGFDSAYSGAASEKFRYKNIKIYNLSPAQANILKQTALTVGADCGTNRDVITGKAEQSDVILGGSYSQLKKICEKLQTQPFKLNKLGNQIKEFFKTKKNKTKIIGILNITPDSFSDGGMFFDELSSQKQLIKLIEDGADGIDIGAESTRPNSLPVSDNEQIDRLKGILKFIQHENIEIPVSIDTRSSVVADFVLNNGVRIINDVSGFDYDKNMIDIVAKHRAGVIIQHSKGTPDIMQSAPSYDNLIEEIYFSLYKKIILAEEAGINNIIVDPGIGFGKTKENNFEILNRIGEFFSLNKPVMIGVSRKSLLGIKEDDNNLKDVLTLALSYPLVLNGVDYLRVHNVKLHKTLINVLF